MSGEDNDTSSEESVGNIVENESISFTNEAVFVVPSVQASANFSFDNLTILVAIPLDPRIPRTTYAGVTATGLTIRDVSHPSVLNREVDDFDTFEDAPKTKRRLPGDFVMKNNTVSLELHVLLVDLDTTKYRIFYMPSCVAMSDYYVYVPVDHLNFGLSVPFDPTFCDFF